MTVSTSTNSVVYRGNGTATQFAVPFKVLDEDHLVVRRRVFATGAIDYTYVGTDYSYAGIGASSGTLTLAGTALDDDYELVIERIVPYTQDLDIVNAGGFYPDTVEEQLDLIVMSVQQLTELAGRAVTVPVGETGGELPAASARAGLFQGYDVDGNLILLSGTGTDGALRTDLAASTGSRLVAWLSAKTGAVIRSIAGLFDERISVLDFIPTSLHPAIIAQTSTADVTVYVQAAIDAGGGNCQIKFPPGRYYITDTIRISNNRTHLRFSGRWVTQFQFEPTANKVMFHFERAASVPDNNSSLDQCSATGGCSISSNDTSYAKIGFKVVNGSITTIRDVHSLGWHTAAGGNSVVVQLAGREWFDIDQICGGMDIAVQVMKNGRLYNVDGGHPAGNAATTIDFDHSQIRRIYVVNTSTVASLTKDTGGGARGIKPSILIDSGVNLTTCSIYSCALALGTDGIVWWDEGAAPGGSSQVSSNFDIRKVRFEQGTSAGDLGFAIIIRRGYDLAGLVIDQCELALDRGIYLRHVLQVWIRGCDYPGATVSIDAVALTANYSLTIDGGSIVPSTLSLTDYFLMLGLGAVPAAQMGYRRYVYDSGIDDADTDLGLRHGDTFRHSFKGSLANGASRDLNISTNTGVTLAQFKVSWAGASKRGRGYADLTTAGGITIGGDSHADFAVTNAATKFCLHTAATATLTNNLGEAADYMITVDYVM